LVRDFLRVGRRWLLLLLLLSKTLLLLMDHPNRHVFFRLLLLWQLELELAGRRGCRGPGRTHAVRGGSATNGVASVIAAPGIAAGC